MATPKINISKIIDFPKVMTPEGSDRILIDREGKGGSITLSQIPIPDSVEGRISDVDKRISVIASVIPEGGTTGDAELRDIRNPAEGFSVPEGANAADAVRSQVTQLDEKISNLKGELDNYKKTEYVPLESKDYTLFDNYFYDCVNTIQRESDAWSFYKILVKEGEKYKLNTLNGSNARAYIIFSLTNTVLSFYNEDSTVQRTVEVIIPANASYILVNARKDGIIKLEKECALIDADKISGKILDKLSKLENESCINYSELVSENNALKVEVARNRRQIENLNDRLDGDLIENKYKMTGETPDDAGVLSLPSSKLLPYAEVDEVYGRTWVWNQLVDQSFLRTITLSRNENLAICQSVVGHIYLIIYKASSDSTFRLKSGTVTLKYMDSNTPSDMSSVEKISGESIFLECPYGGTITITTFAIIDLTTLFGVTEVAQVTDWMKAWVKDYAEAHPQYDAGTLISASNGNVKSVGKNLLNSVLESSSGGGITCTRKGDGIYTINGTVSASAYPEFILGRITLKAGTYTISNESYDGDNPYLWVGDESYPNGIVNNFWSENRTFTLTEKKTVRITFVGTPGQTFSNKVIKPMLETGSVATDYSLYLASTITIPSDWYTKAEAQGLDLGMEGTVIDFNEKKVTWNCNKVDLGSLYYISSTPDSSGLYRYECTSLITTDTSLGYCSRFMFNPTSNHISGTEEFLFHGGSHNLLIFTATNFGSPSEFKSAMTGVKLVYKSPTPVTKTFTELGFDPVDNGLAIESNGTISVVSDGATAEALIHYAIDNRSTT